LVGAREGDEAEEVPQRVELAVTVKGNVQGTVQTIADLLRNLKPLTTLRKLPW
jgi:hypothetical protein